MCAAVRNFKKPSVINSFCLSPIAACRKRERERVREEKREKEEIRERQEGDSKSKRCEDTGKSKTSKSDALSKHRPACTCALSNAYICSYICDIFLGMGMGDRRLYRFRYICISRFYLDMNSRMRKNDLSRGYSKVRDCIEINYRNNILMQERRKMYVAENVFAHCAKIKRFLRHWRTFLVVIKIIFKLFY